MVNTNRCGINISILRVFLESIYMEVEELEDFNPLDQDYGQASWLIIKTADAGAKPDYFNKGYDKKIKKGFLLWYKRKQMLNLDEEFKYKDIASLKQISLSIGLRKHPKNRKKLIHQIKKTIMQKNWRSVDKIYEKIKRTE
jgi:hypothetical protein